MIFFNKSNWKQDFFKFKLTLISLIDSSDMIKFYDYHKKSFGVVLNGDKEIAYFEW